MLYILAVGLVYQTKKKQIPWPESTTELYLPNDRRLSEKLVPNFANRRRHVVSVTDPYGRILGFLDRGSGVSLIYNNWLNQHLVYVIYSCSITVVVM
jgi:CBS-domain-containing membrane protein